MVFELSGEVWKCGLYWNIFKRAPWGNNLFLLEHFNYVFPTNALNLMS